MPKLIIDNREVVVAPGTKVIDAAARLGIMIPRFCYHPALGAVGACRVCAVMVLEGPERMTGIQMSCMLEARDGMVVSTTDEEAVDFRRHIIEFLMLHHPHDCPVCDEGGHCLLQDTTVSGGHGIRRFRGKKRTHVDQHLGPLLQHEMNRCIQCYRCVRFYREFAGATDLGVMGIGSRVYYGRYREGTLQSPFSGNLSDICPTGVFTDKPSRYKGRRWDFERSPSVCIHCSLGCHTVVSSRYREVVRQEARFSGPVNGYFVCDRGRYGFYYASDRKRPRHALVNGAPADMSSAVQEARNRLEQVVNTHGSTAVACVGSLRSSLETLGAMKNACGSRGWQGPFFFRNEQESACVAAAARGLHRDTAVSLSEVAGADLIIVLGADPINEAPMAALAMRQAERAGAAVLVLDPRPVSLPMNFRHIPLLPAETGRLLASAVGLAEDAPSGLGDETQALADAVAASQRPVMICGTDVATPALAAAAAGAASRLKASGKDAGLLYLLPGANALGAALFSEKASSMDKVVDGIEAGQVRALVLVENDLPVEYPHRERLERAFDKLEVLVVVDYLDTPLLQRAAVFLPSATVFEAGGIFINQEGRAQRIRPAFQGGLPLSQISGGGHPPREFAPGIPGNDIEPAWEAVARLSGEFPAEHAGLGERFPALATLENCRPFPDDGVLLDRVLGLLPEIDPPKAPEVADAKDALTLIFTEQTFGTEALSSRSPCLRELEPAPRAVMHETDAAALGLTDGDVLVIDGIPGKGDSGRITIGLSTTAKMAQGVVVIPRHRRFDWQRLGSLGGRVDRKRLKKG